MISAYLIVVLLDDIVCTSLKLNHHVDPVRWVLPHLGKQHCEGQLSPRLHRT
jgi:hypothetical protein